ncbi:MAG TPA: ABC transporter permease [Methanocella sp.]|jgi:molybdate transport system permease protein
MRIGIPALLVIMFFLLAILYIALPVLSLFLKADLSSLPAAFDDPLVRDALWLSLVTTVASTVIVVVIGTPIAYVTARYRYPGKEIIDSVIDLPVVMPPAVAGIALLMAYGRLGVAGQYFNAFGITFAFTTTAVIMAQLFVASPFYIRQARTSFEDVDRTYEHAARTLGASPVRAFFCVTVPIAMNGLVSGAILSWARALGEFGATIMFAGNFQGRTQTMPLAIYMSMNTDLNASLILSILLVVISFIVIVAIKILTRRRLIHDQD